MNVNVKNCLNWAKEIWNTKKPKFKIDSYLDWQDNVFNLLNEQNDRKILFVIDYKGGVGKTTLTKDLVANHNGILLPGN